MDKRFWGFLVVIALVLSGVFFVTNSNKATAPAESKSTLTNHVEGSGSTGVKLVEYGDFQCPACSQYYLIIKQVTDKYGSLMTFQFRHFPLFQIHTNAMASSRAAEAADKQGKFWEMYDVLYANQRNWSGVSDPTIAFDTYAKQLGLNITKFKQDYKSPAVNDSIQADLKEGNRLGIDSTPTFFLAGKKISVPNPTLEAFSKLIDAEIVKKGGTPPAATVAQPATTAPAAGQ